MLERGKTLHANRSDVSYTFLFLLKDLQRNKTDTVKVLCTSPLAVVIEMHCRKKAPDSVPKLITSFGHESLAVLILECVSVSL